MPIREMPAFVFSHKNVLRAVICALLSCFFLLVQLILMRKDSGFETVFEIVFDVVIPFSAAVTFGCHAITMAMDRPFILINSVTVYFLSLLIRQLAYVEIGVGVTYPYITLIECIPYVFYCVSAATDKLKKATRGVIIGGCAVLGAFVLVMLVMLLAFKKALFYPSVRSVFAMVFGQLAILAVYIGMLEQLKIMGTKKRVRAHAGDAEE